MTNQRSSGRCWLFAATNVFRVPIMKRYNLKEFELSQAYLFFWDKLEKANYFLEQILDTMEEDLDGRLLQTLLSSPVGDGGQWDMAANLVEKYGLVNEPSAISSSCKDILLIPSGPSLSLPRLLQCYEFQRHELINHHQAPRRCSRITSAIQQRLEFSISNRRR